MIIKIKYVLVLLLFFIAFGLFSQSLNKYENVVLGFRFNYPSSIQLRNITGLEKPEEINHKYIVDMGINNIDELNEYSSMDFYQEFKKVEKKKGFMNESKKSYENISFEYFKYRGKVVGQTSFHLNVPEVNQRYIKGLEIKRKNYFISFVIDYSDYPTYSIPDRYPEYFERIEEEVLVKNGKKRKVQYNPTWKEPIEKNYIEFYNLIKKKNKKAPQELVKLWEYFDVILNSLELFEPAKYVTPTVKKLSLRKDATTGSERIRVVTKGEKLEVLDDINPPELIGGDYGFWVKVKTSKGEIGWCFDAYLEEVKKKR